jgi:hypothetical protein
MRVFNRRVAVGLAGWAILIAGPAAAQENLDQGKTAAQLYASDCAICHKTPRGLSQAGGMLGVQSFLRQHYTASREAAAAIASYLAAIDRGAAPAPKPAATAKRAPKPGEPSVKPKGDAKGADAKASEPKASEPKASEPKASEPKPAAAGESKPAEPAAKPDADKKD